MEQSVEVEALEQDRLFTIRSLSGPVRLRVEHWLEPRDGSTYLHVVGEADLGGFSRLGAPMVRRQARRMFESDFARLKRALEAR
jgi:hypothetical protein